MNLQPDDLDQSNKMMAKRLKHMKMMIHQADQTKKEALEHDPIIIAFIDKGCFSSHGRLKDIVIHDEITFPGEAATVDMDNHGTVVAGVLWRYAGQIINGFKGQRSVVKLINIKLAGPGAESFKKALEIIEKWEKDKKRNVDIITTSQGLFKDLMKHPQTRAIIDEVNQILKRLSKDRIIMAAASNEGKTDNDTVLWPATEDSVLGINSIDNLGNTTDFAGQGDGVDFAFPGKAIWSTSRPPSHIKNPLNNIPLFDDLKNVPQNFSNRTGINNDWWIKLNGSSFAAPHCAAAVAIVLAYIHIGLGKQARIDATRTEFMKDLMKIGRTERKHQTGYGFPQFDLMTLELIYNQLYN